MKTINELNTRMWFRALKVLYIIFVVILYLMALVSIVVVTSVIQENKNIFAEEQEEKNEKTELIVELKNKGYSTIEIGEELKKRYPSRFVQLTREQFKLIYGEEEYLKFGNDNFETKEPVPDTPGTLKWLFLIVPVSIFIAWLISQLVKWVFYYIVLGAIKPNNYE